jgi:hypothetical protein
VTATEGAVRRLERFVERVPEAGCWLWLGATNESGYGRFSFGGRNSFAHRVSYELHIGAIPDGLWVLHRCDVPCCVNPAHFFLGTRSDNVSDAVAKNRLRPRRGEENGRAKLTVNDVAFIRDSGLPARALAKLLGMSPVTIWDIRAARIWKHVSSGRAH